MNKNLPAARIGRVTSIISSPPRNNAIGDDCHQPPRSGFSTESKASWQTRAGRLRRRRFSSLRWSRRAACSSPMVGAGRSNRGGPARASDPGVGACMASSRDALNFLGRSLSTVGPPVFGRWFHHRRIFTAATLPGGRAVVEGGSGAPIEDPRGATAGGESPSCTPGCARARGDLAVMSRISFKAAPSPGEHTPLPATAPPRKRNTRCLHHGCTTGARVRPVKQPRIAVHPRGPALLGGALALPSMDATIRASTVTSMGRVISSSTCRISSRGHLTQCHHYRFHISVDRYRR